MFKELKFAEVSPYLIVGFLILTVKLLLISVYGNATPFWDQWDAEADRLYRPWLEGSLEWAELFAPHNEHRIFTTRLLGLFLLELNGKVWDPILQMQVNAVLHVFALCVLLFLAMRVVPEKKKFALFVFVAVVFSIPFGWENTLAGFQSQFYFLLLFSFIFLWSMASYEVYSARWWGGLLAGILCTLSLASGALTVIAGVVILTMRGALGRQRSGVAISAIFLLTAVAVISIALTPTVPHHSSLKAQDLLQFLQALSAILSWPNQGVWLGLVVVHVPLLFFVLKVIRDPSFRTPGHYFIVAVGAWVFGQFLSIAYGRSVGFNSSRYLDLFAVGLVVEFSSLLALSRSDKHKWVLYLAGFIWVGVVIFGFVSSSSQLRGDLQNKVVQGLEQERSVRDYLCTGDFQNISGKPYLHVPYPNSDRLKSLLDNAYVRSILPGNIYEPNASRRFFTDGEPFCRQEPLARAFNVEDWGEGKTSDFANVGSVLLDGWKGTDYFRSDIENLKIIGSVVQSEVNTGFVTLHLNRGAKVLYRTGPRVSAQFVLVNNSGVEGFYTDVPVSIEWKVMSFDNVRLPDEFEVTFVDAGTGWGEWSAVGIRKN